MKTQNKKLKLRPRFEPEAAWELTPVPAAPARGPQEVELERLKETLLNEALNRTKNPAVREPLRQAVHDAAALAWTTPFPLLVLPELLREKVEGACRYVAKQATVRGRGTKTTGRAA